jgi:propanol-preferring alcohol dehydrogenase
MRCAVLEKPLDRFLLKEADTPEPKGFEVIVRVKSAGLCHTDVHIWEGHYGPLKVEERGIKFPLILGHEIAGEVFKVGEYVTEIKPGDKVVVFPWIGCGFCKACRKGEENLCVLGTKPLGIIRAGGFAEYVLVPHQKYVVKVDVDLIKAAPISCGGITAYNAVKKAELLPDDIIIVIGVGGVGHLALQMIKKMYGVTLIAVDVRESALKLAEKLGADYVFNSTKNNLAEEIKKITYNLGVDAVIDFVAHADTVSNAFNILKRGGRLVLVGIGGEYINLTLPLIPLKNVSIRGSYVGSITDLMEVLALLKKGIIDVATTTYTLDQINDVFESFRAGQIVGRAVFTP